MHILVSFCNVRTSGLPLLGLFDSAASEFRVLDLPCELARCSGITGLAASDRFVYAVAQASDRQVTGAFSGTSVLLIFDRKDLTLRSRYAFRSAVDVHSLWVRGDYLYAVSTGTDEILELRIRDGAVTSEVSFWRPDPDGPYQDIHHLNALYDWKGDLLVSGFGKKADKSWNSARDGFVINVTRRETLARGIDQPHSLVGVDGDLAYCESRRLKVGVIGNCKVQHLPGYTRGLCLVGRKLFIATSMGRKQSRSTGALNNPAGEGVIGGQCTISRLAADTFEVEQTIDLSAHAHEIYDLIAVEGSGRWPVVPEVAWRDRSIRELSVALDERITWSKRVTEELAQRDATIRDLRVRLDDADTFRSVVAELRRTICRQVDELEAQRAALEVLSKSALKVLQRAVTEFSNALAYRDLIARVRTIVHVALPKMCTLLVVSKGDENLLQLDGRKASHFPQAEGGVYAGFNPADSGSAIVQLEALRSKGAQYLLFPSPALWWLDHYRGLKRHLDQHYRRCVYQSDLCVIYSLCEPARADEAHRGAEVGAVIAEFGRRFGKEPAILDWNTGLNLVELFPEQTVFSPPCHAGQTVPYLDHTVDVVAVAAPDAARATEARRVAAAAVVTWPAVGGKPEVEWLKGPQAPSLPTTSIVIPSYNGIALTEACLSALAATLPSYLQVEIIVVDDCSTDNTEPRLARWLEREPRLKVLRNPQNCGFLVTCNNGAAAASGQIVILLNNDTLPLYGWLEPLLRTFRDHPDAGAVGGKLVYPDGRLQEAGGVLFADGSAANFGKGDYEVDAPLYNYLRDVDYVSGALLATPRALFSQLGGLDTRYRPIYYEDADYCFRVWENGYKVLYQPESVVIHLEGVTCGTDPSTGQKRHQVVNRAKFEKRWQETLKRQPPPPGNYKKGTWYALAASRCPEVGQGGRA
jgi:GT2 family glycosyltransferase